MKGSENFKNVILLHVAEFAAKNDLFAKAYNNPKKNIDDCITYILNQVKASGQSGFDDGEIFNMAIHYYDEENIDIGDKVNGKVSIISNHHVDLSAEEIAEIKQKAKDDLFKAEQERIKKNKPTAAAAPKKSDVLPNDRPQLSLF